MIRTTIMADEKTLYQISRIAQEQGKSKAAIIREALANYVAEQEAQAPPENPLLRLIGLAGDAGEETDMSDGKDEEILRTEWVEHLERYR